MAILTLRNVKGSPLTNQEADDNLSALNTELGTKQAALSNASASVSGILTSTDWTTFNDKQAALVSGTSIKTVNGTTLLGSGDLVITGGASATKTISNKTAAYTVVAGDLGTIINCTSGTFTITLTAAATLGTGFVCTIWNTGTGAITIDPAAAETIDGYTTWILRSGEGLAVVCNGINWLIDDKKPMRGYAENRLTDARPIASGPQAVSIGVASTASGNYSLALGALTTASGANAVAIGNTTTTADANYSSAIGLNSTPTGSVTATGAGAMALGGSYASGTDSFAAAIASNTSTYGATGANSIAIGKTAKATGPYSTAIGEANIASGADSFAAGYGSTASGIGAIAIGYGGTMASGSNSVALGEQAAAVQIGKYAYAAGRFATVGDAQSGKIVIRAQNSTTATILTSDGAAASTTNQLIVATGQSMAIQGTLIAKQSGNGNITAWNITGAVSNNAGTVSSTGLALTLIGTDSIGYVAVPTITLDTVNKAVKITSGTTGTQTRYVATLNTTEVTFA